MAALSWVLIAAWVAFFFVAIHDSTEWTIRPACSRARQRRSMIVVAFGLPILMFAVWTVLAPEIERGGRELSEPPTRQSLTPNNQSPTGGKP